MDFKVVFKESFIHDLEQIVRLIASQNTNAARNLGNLIVDRCESLKFFPERHPKVRQRTGIRRFVVQKNFKVFYRVRLGV
jgi:plasmid stabilization system protein ParE